MDYLLVLYLFSMAGISVANYGCLTWEIRGHTLILTCRPDNFVETLSILDVYGTEQGVCAFHGQNPPCVSYRNGNITADFERIKITLEINDIQTDVNGKWLCLQGNSEFASVVSTSEGIIAATGVYLYGQYMDYDHVKFTCSSCREPAGNYVEFFIDGKSVTGISYSRRTRRCKKADGECKPGVCSCSVSGNQFTNVFVISNETKEQMFSCEMRFVDPLLLNRFYKTAKIHYNGSDLITKRTITKLTKPASRKFVPLNSSEDVTSTSTPFTSTVPTTTKITNDSKTQSRSFTVWILVGIICLLLILILTYYLVTKQKKTGAISRKDESSSLIETGAISRKDESSSLIAISHTDERKDMLQKHPSENKHKSYCEPCLGSSKETVALHWCLECSERLCHQCKKIHSYMKMSCGHIIISIDEVPENYCLSHVVICEEHEGKNREYICMDHNELYCKECIDAKHKTCETMLLMLYYTKSDLPRLIEQQMSQITQSLNVLEECKAECFEIKKYWELKASTIEKIVEKQIDDLILSDDSIICRKSSMSFKLTEVWRKLTRTKILEIEKDINSLENHVVLVNEQKTFIDFTNRYCSKMQLLELIYSKIKPVLRDVNDQIQQINNKNLKLRQRHQTQVAVK